MSTEENKELVRNFIEKVWNEGQYILIPHFIDENYVAISLGSNNTLRGPEGVLANVQNAHKTFARFRISIEDMLGEGEKVVSRLTLHCVQDLKPLTMREIIIHRIDNGKIVEAWSLGSNWD